MLTIDENSWRLLSIELAAHASSNNMKACVDEEKSFIEAWEA